MSDHNGKQREQITAAKLETTPLARDERLELEIERALVDDRDANDAFVVYADWLQQRQDPRGELIACQLPSAQTKAKRRAGVLLNEHRRYFLGIFGSWDDEPPLQVEWRCGFLRSAHLYVGRRLEDDGWDQAVLTEALLALPSSRFLEELEVGCGSIHEEMIDERVQAALREHGPLTNLRRLRFVTDQEEEMLSWTDAGDLGHLSKTTPNLTSLGVEAGSVRLGEPDLPRLKELVIETCGLTDENVESIASARWPELTKLVLWFGSQSYGVDIDLDGVLLMLDRSRFPKLTHLGLCNNEMTDDLLEALAANPLLGQLESLDLSKGTMADAGARRMIELAPRLAHLKKIDVSANYIGKEGAALKKALKQVDLGKFPNEQREAEEFDDEIHRYADVGE